MSGPARIDVVTGAAGGIGTALVRRLVDAGRRVLVTDHDAVAAAELADELRVPWAKLDVTRAESWDELLGRLETDRLIVRGLALNAGIAGLSSPTEFDLQRYRQGCAVNIDGVVNGLVSLSPMLQRTEGSSVVVTASIAGLTGAGFDPFYAMTKHAVVGLVRSIAEEYHSRGVRIQAVCPGFVDTGLLGDARETMDRTGYPLLSPDEIAVAIAECLRGERTDLVTVLQPGRAAAAYRFAGIPGPGKTSVGLPTDLKLGRRSDG